MRSWAVVAVSGCSRWPGVQGEKRDNELHQGCKSVDLGNNRRKLVSHRMAMHDAGAEYGIFVDVLGK